MQRKWFSFIATKILLVFLVFSVTENVILFFKWRKADQINRTLIALNTKTLPRLKTGDTLPKIELVDLEQGTRKEGLTGHKIIFVFSASCPACQRNFDNWKEIERQVGTENVMYVSVNKPADILVYAREKGIASNTFSFQSPKDQMALKISSIPQTITSSEGKALHVATGVLNSDEMKATVAAFREKREVANSTSPKSNAESCN